MSEIVLSVPCEDCGCDTVIGSKVADGTPTCVQVCACSDGSGEFDLMVTHDYGNEETQRTEYHKCDDREMAYAFLNQLFDVEQIKHHCLKG